MKILSAMAAPRSGRRPVLPARDTWMGVFVASAMAAEPSTLSNASN